MKRIADVTVHDARGEPTLIVEVKNRIGTSREWAMKMHRNILARGSPPGACFLLLALPDRFYLWKETGTTPETLEPSYEIDPAPFLEPYYETTGLRPEKLSREGFELIVTSWLSEVLWADALPQQLPPEKEWLRESGLFEAIRGGHLASEVPV